VWVGAQVEQLILHGVPVWIKRVEDVLHLAVEQCIPMVGLIVDGRMLQIQMRPPRVVGARGCIAATQPAKQADQRIAITRVVLGPDG